jgi:hypothetical protein
MAATTNSSLREILFNLDPSDRIHFPVYEQDSLEDIADR